MNKIIDLIILVILVGAAVAILTFVFGCAAPREQEIVIPEHPHATISP